MRGTLSTQQTHYCKKHPYSTRLPIIPCYTILSYLFTVCTFLLASGAGAEWPLGFPLSYRTNSALYKLVELAITGARCSRAQLYVGSCLCSGESNMAPCLQWRAERLEVCTAPQLSNLGKHATNTLGRKEKKRLRISPFHSKRLWKTIANWRPCRVDASLLFLGHISCCSSVSFLPT